MPALPAGLQTIAGVAFCPIDIIKQRVQTQAVLAGPGAASIGPLAAVRQVYAAAGVPGEGERGAAPWAHLHGWLATSGRRRWPPAPTLHLGCT